MATPQMDERTPLTLVKDVPETAAVYDFEKRPRPAWMMSAQQLRQWAVYAKDNCVDWCIHHATHSPYYLGWSVRGYGRLIRHWWRFRDDGYRQMIRSAKQMLRDADGKPADEAKAKALKDVRRAERKAHNNDWWFKSFLWASAGATGVGIGASTAGLWFEIPAALAVIVTGAYFGRPNKPAVAPIQAPTRTSHLGEETMRRVLVEAGAVPEKRGEEIRGVGIPHTEGPGIAYAVHTPSGIPAAVAVGRKQQVASALGVHSDWLDLSVGNVETLLLVWVASEDPFGVVRSSPLLDHKGPVNTFRDGIPASFAKRGNPITLRIRDTSILVAGATRRGKGMFLANVLIGVMKDPWVNVRIFDGKGTAEHNPYASTLATFVKRNPERLAIITRAIVAELDRRSDLLDEHGYEKVEDEHYDEIMELLGGREVFIVDELATYTPKGTSPYDEEITENLSQIAAVGAALGVLLISVTQVPEVSVIRGRLRQNHIGRAAMNTESGTASNTILGDGMTGQGYDASKIPIDQPGRFWLATPETGVIEGRSYLVTPDDKRRVAAEGYEIRKAAGRLPGQWHDPIEEHLQQVTGVSSAAGGEGGKGRIVHFDFLTWLEDLALSTGRGNVTNLEVFTSLADVSAEYARRDGESDEGWTARVGKLVRDLIAATGAELRVKRVPVDDGKRSQGYLLDDVTKARKSRK